MLQGWVVTDRRADELVRAVFGGDGASIPFPLCGKGEWSVAHRVDRSLPLGPPTALVVLSGPTGSAAEVAMGWQACTSAPDDRIRTWTFSFGDGEMAVLDARCWVRPKTGQVSASLWMPQSFWHVTSGHAMLQAEAPHHVLPSGTTTFTVPRTYVPE